MNDFFSDLLSTLAIFAICLVISFILVRIFRPTEKRKKQKPKEAVYYVSAKQERPKPKTLAIKGTLLSQDQLDELMRKKDD